MIGDVAQFNEPRYVGAQLGAARSLDYRRESRLVFRPIKNPSDDEIHQMIKASTHQAARRIHDHRTGDVWYWPAEQATHREGAKALGIPYDKPPGAGDIVVL